MFDIHVSDKEWGDAQDHGFARCGQIEASILTALASNALLPFSRVIIHAVAFAFQGLAWLITAQPSVGKSTQIRYLMDLYPNDFSIICGDRPVLQLMDDGTFLVHPSPWNGKEGWRGTTPAPLAGILCLQRGTVTSIKRLKTREAVMPVYESLISTRDTAEQIHMLSDIETALLNAVPVYEYINGGVPDSTKILYQFLMEGAISDDV